jgi:hypothetical protein
LSILDHYGLKGYRKRFEIRKAIMQIDLIAGARPNFMKIATMIDAIKASPEATSRLNF